MRWAFVVMNLVAAVAVAAPKTVIVAADCADPVIFSGARDFRETAGKLLGESLLDSESVLDIVRPRPTRSVQDIERSVDSAKALFYGGQVDRAQELVERALLELERASPLAKPWPVTQQALVLLALVHKSSDRQKEMSDTFRKLVRLDPNFKLDPDAHPPSAIAALEAVKKELARTRKSPLAVRVDAGPAAQVFIDGQAMGSTPLKLELPPGTYRVSLSAPGMVSFPHRVELPRDSVLSVDFNFEGAVGQQAPLCLLAGAGDDAALKLGQLVTAERLIVLRNTARQGAPPELTGTLFELTTGQQARTGTVRPEGLSSLATFLVTGKKQGPVTTDAPRAQPAKVDPPRAEAPAATAPARPIDPPPPAPIAAREPTGVPSPAQPSFVGFGVSAALVAAGVAAGWAGFAHYNHKLASDARFRLVNIIGDDGKLPLSSLLVGMEAIDLMKAVDENRAQSFTLIGAGAGAVIAGAVGMWLFFPSASATVAVSPSPSGASVSVSGSF